MDHVAFVVIILSQARKLNNLRCIPAHLRQVLEMNSNSVYIVHRYVLYTSTSQASDLSLSSLHAHYSHRRQRTVQARSSLKTIRTKNYSTSSESLTNVYNFSIEAPMFSPLYVILSTSAAPRDESLVLWLRDYPPLLRYLPDTLVWRIGSRLSALLNPEHSCVFLCYYSSSSL